MKTLLVLAPHPDLADAVRGALDPEKYRLIHRISIEESEPLLIRGVLDLCILDVELTTVQGIWVIEKLRRRLPTVPVIIFTDARDWQWEEEAYLHGVSHILNKPARPRTLNALVERLWTHPVAPRVPVKSITTNVSSSTTSLNVSGDTEETLTKLRNFSGILTHSLNSEGLLRKFLLQLREILGVNRAALFLRQSTSGLNPNGAPEASRSMRSACALGLSPGLLEHFELSFETGIGGYLHREGRIIRRDSVEVYSDPQMQKEFEILGAQVAVPMFDRERLIGVAAFDGRVTGEPIGNSELELIFHLLEELGLAVKNIWLHDQLLGNNEMMTDILRELSSACVVVSRDLVIQHANKAAKHLFSKPGNRSVDLEFSDIPQAMGSKVYQVIKTGAGVATFKHQPADAPQKLFHVTVVPFVRPGATAAHAALLIVEDHTQAEAFRKLEIEAANLRLIKVMADRLAHEVGNALVPLSTHQQLLGEKFKDPEFRASLDLAMSDGVKRVSRLINQMRYLARDSVLSKEAVSLTQLIDEAYKEAYKYQPTKSAKLYFDDGKQPIILVGDRHALKHALSEVILNAIQANVADAKIQIQSSTENGSSGQGWVHIEIVDNGGGFSPDAAQKVPAPFFTTRTVGLGLGLCVTKKVLEVHQGRLTIVNPGPGNPGTVRISLPLNLAGNPPK
jgi:signal transduction histidine kinase/DNA-binding NarL/FixJ family response regulator